MESDKVFDTLIDLSRGQGEIKGLLAGVHDRVEYSIKLHETCAARLGYQSLLDKTSKIRTIKDSDTSIMPPAMLKAKAFANLKVLWPLVTGILLGAAFIGAIIRDLILP